MRVRDGWLVLASGLLLLVGTLTAARATEPALQAIDITPDAGKTLQCEGRLYALRESSNVARDCRGLDPERVTCAQISVERCAIWWDVAFVHCAGAVLSNAQFTELSGLPLVNAVGDIDVLQELEKRGVPRSDPSFWPQYRQLIDAKIARKPRVRVSGRLASCVACADCYPARSCELADCSVQRSGGR